MLYLSPYLRRFIPCAMVISNAVSSVLILQMARMTLTPNLGSRPERALLSTVVRRPLNLSTHSQTLHWVVQLSPR